jgi:2-polyprenyl-3-methyl-5-hydroxy-6-metoxy-1,4-benzoquinol methylase
MKAVSEVASDFNGIAEALAELPARQRLLPCEGFLLSNIPPSAQTALDVGCGDGMLSRELARRRLRVTAIDLSPRMVAVACNRTPSDLPIEYRVADVMRDEMAVGCFDVVVSVNMVHHVAINEVIPRLAALVAPGGVLLIQDVVVRAGARYLPRNIAAFAAKLFRNARELRLSSGRTSRLYAQHGRNERYFTPEEADEAYRRLLPGVVVRHHAEWRYSAVWRRDRNL